MMLICKPYRGTNGRLSIQHVQQQAYNRFKENTPSYLQGSNCVHRFFYPDYFQLTLSLYFPISILFDLTKSDFLHCIPLILFTSGPLLPAAAAKSLQSYPTLCNPVDCSLPGSSIHGIFQARVLEWSAIAFSALLPSPGETLSCSPPARPAFLSLLSSPLPHQNGPLISHYLMPCLSASCSYKV